MSPTEHGPKLNALIAGGCIDATQAAELSPQQVAAIEALTWIQVGTMIEVHAAVGQVPNGIMI
jgi:hypothetical protein